jgi:signal transduction histidine kinase
MTRRDDHGTPYTRATMEMGTLGDRRQAEFDSLYAEAKQALGASANQLRMVTERLRQAYGADLLEYQASPESDADAPQRRIEAGGLARAKALLGRLEVTVRDLEQSWLFLERGTTGAWKGTGRSAADQPLPDLPHRGVVAMQILEAQEAERALVAEELHDGPAQAISNAAFQVEIIDRALRSDPAAAHAELSALREQLDREVDRMRGFIHQLHPMLAEDGGLDRALAELAHRMTEENGIPVAVELRGPQDMLDAPLATAVLRVAQEALRNVRKHALASSVRITTYLESSRTDRSPDTWVLEVTDNGQGFVVDETLDRTPKRHFGLRFMRERAQLIGARLDIVSDPATGTTVRLAFEPGKRS